MVSRFNVRLLRRETPEALAQEMRAIGVDPRGIAIMTPKARWHLLRVENLPYAAASILKQELLAKGGDAALAGSIYFGGERTTAALLMGTARTFERVCRVLAVQPLPTLQALGAEIEAALRAGERAERGTLRLGEREFAWGSRTYIAAIVNVTPDSFSGDGLLREAEASPTAALERGLAQALDAVEHGADIIDVGGESTRPGAAPVDAATEIARVVPLIERLHTQTDVPISIDTYKAEVARAALDAGAVMVNDVWALQADKEMAPLIAERGAAVILMHNRSRPHDVALQERLGGRYIGVAYDDLLGDVLRELRELVARAEVAGIARDQIIIDPGIGFGKTVEQNLALLNHLDELRVLGLPVLIGPSRKSFIGYTLELPPSEREEGTAAAVALGIARGADVVRVHNVQRMARVARMSDALIRAH